MIPLDKVIDVSLKKDVLTIKYNGEAHLDQESRPDSPKVPAPLPPSVGRFSSACFPPMTTRLVSGSDASSD